MIEHLKKKIKESFAQAEYPGDWALVGSREGNEPVQVAQEFQGKTDWRTLDGRFLDKAPRGLGTALSFFSDEAFRFYLPAYLIADLNGDLQSVHPLQYLIDGVTDDSLTEKISARRFGERTWFDAARFKFSIFSRAEADAIKQYLRFKQTTTESKDEKKAIDEAMKNYWGAR